MCYKATTHDFRGNEINEKDRHYALCCWYNESSLVCGLERKETIPAWSLHRLILLLGTIACDWIFRDGDCYTNAINGIEWLINNRFLEKEYLV